LLKSAILKSEIWAKISIKFQTVAFISELLLRKSYYPARATPCTGQYPPPVTTEKQGQEIYNTTIYNNRMYSNKRKSTVPGIL